MKYSLHVTAWDSAECVGRELDSGPAATFVTSGADGGNDGVAEVGRSRLTVVSKLVLEAPKVPALETITL